MCLFDIYRLVYTNQQQRQRQNKANKKNKNKTKQQNNKKSEAIKNLKAHISRAFI